MLEGPKNLAGNPGSISNSSPAFLRSLPLPFPHTPGHEFPSTMEATPVGTGVTPAAGLEGQWKHGAVAWADQRDKGCSGPGPMPLVCT